MHLYLHPVYSLLTTPADIPPEVAAGLPAGMQLSQHQLATYKAQMGRTHDVIVNTAMTGDGKSLAMYLPTLIHTRRQAFAMYPTIELSRDQQKQFAHYTALFGRQIRHEALWGARLGELARERSAKRRGEVIKELFSNRQVILTNPDIFHLVMNYRYGSSIYSDQELPYTLLTNFDAFHFDEFHIFSMPQIVATITAMLFFLEYDPQKAPQFLFSSATPDPLFIEMMERAGIRFDIIPGAYSTEDGNGYRQVLHPAELTLHKLGEDEDVEGWLRRNIHLVIDHWRHATTKPKGAIILNSVMTARRVARALPVLLQPHGICVGEVSGLVDDERRREMIEHADLVVGTSTIDVGIDFSISLLIFETLDAGSFLQRLGRLARVRFNGQVFNRYEAHALISPRTPWIYDRFVQRFGDRGVKDGDAIDRPETLRSVVTDSEVFTRPTQFRSFAKRWGILQAAHVIQTLRRRQREGGFESLAEALQRRYEAAFMLKDFGRAIGRYKQLTRSRSSSSEKKSPEERRNEAILNEVLSFRGASPFQAAVWDTTTEPPTFLDYDALALVQNARYEVVDEVSYKAELERQPQSVRERALEELHHVMKGKSEAPLVLRINEFVQDREQLVLDWEDLHLQDYIRYVTALKKFQMQQPRLSQDIDRLNAFLRDQLLVCYIIRKERGGDTARAEASTALSALCA